MKMFEYPPGATPLNQVETDGLKRKYITTLGELDRWEQENIQEAIAWLARRRKSNMLNEKFICLLHAKMFSNVWVWAGYFRKSDKNVGVNWKTIPIAVRQLLDDVKYGIQHNVFTPDEIAARVHHRLVYIHLFPNGNGRHARLITDVLLSEILNRDLFSWGSGGNLSSTGDLRRRYIDALKAADLHDYKQLLKFVRS